MNDEKLIARLRKQSSAGRISHVSKIDRLTAADRIESLTEQRDEALNQLDSARHSVDVLEKRVTQMKDERDAARRDAVEAETYVGELEANLAKAVDALGDLVKDCEADYPPSHGAVKYYAQRTLAELTGGKDE